MMAKGHEYKGKRISPLQFVMLATLKEKPMYGYELLKSLREQFEGVWSPQTGTVYPALKRLEDHGLVNSEKKQGTEYYILTEEGKTFLSDYIKQVPGDIQFVTRYFEILERVSKELKEGDSTESEITHNKALMERMFEDQMDPKERLNVLKSMREFHVKRITEIQIELEEIEKEL